MNFEIKARAKINISLDVTAKLDDGYHEMCMIMESVKLYDRIYIWPDKSGKISLKTNLKYLPCDERNIAVKAARLFFEETGIKGWGVSMYVDKRIPVCAGLGGGSTDGAAVLTALNRIFSAELSQSEICRIGGKLGSDVPYCLTGGTVLATGKGDILEELPSMPKCPVVICKPGFPISTPTLFKRLDKYKVRCHPDTEGIIAALSAGDLCGIACRMYNVFEDVLPQNFSDVGEIKTALIDSGALGAVMSGTGSAVFGLFDNADKAKKAYFRLRNVWRECFLTEIV